MLGRVVVAIALTVGFYLLTLAVAVGLLAIPCLEWTQLGAIHLNLAFGCLVGASATVVTALPRRIPMKPPGPRLLREEQPRVHQFVEEIARACGEPMPAALYLVPDLNAFVTQTTLKPGVSKRILGIGLPMFQILSLTQLRAVLAHEFGHFKGGDVKLGSWLYQVRAAIGRNIAERPSGVFGFFFRGYGRLFLRVTHAISRRQELAADELAIEVAGADAHVSALERTAALAPSVGTFWRDEVRPLLEMGFLPPLEEGLSRYVTAPPRRAEQTERLAQQRALEKEDPYSTHPPLRARVEAARRLPPVTRPGGGGGSALGLLDDRPRLERDLIAWVTRTRVDDRLAPIAWDDIAQVALVPSWRKLVASRPKEFANATVADAPRLLRSVAANMKKAPKRSVFQQELARGRRLSCAVAIAYVDAGFELKAQVGTRRLFVRDGVERDLFAELGELVNGRISEEEWRTRCATDGVEDRPLAPQAPARR